MFANNKAESFSFRLKEKDVFSKQLVSSFSVKKNEENLNYFEIIPNIAYKGEMVMAMYLRWNKTHHHK